MRGYDALEVIGGNAEEIRENQRWLSELQAGFLGQSRK